MTSEFVESQDFATAVKTYAMRALQGRPVSARTVAQFQFAGLDDAQWPQALQALQETLMRLDGRNARRWGMTANQGSRFCRWRRGRQEHMND